jgi:hypothetical protein
MTTASPDRTMGEGGSPVETRAEAPPPRNRPNQDEERGRVEGRPSEGGIGQEPRGVQEHIADDDKLARTGSVDEKVRDTPPAGEWNDTTYD